MFERIRKALADPQHNPRPRELDDPALKEEYLRWRNDGYQRKLAEVFAFLAAQEQQEGESRSSKPGGA
jgi:hypothetical protein